MPKRFSTKDLTVVVAPTADRMGIGRFTFTDDYSVFHFGKMPDRIPGKGEAICRMAVANFEMLSESGVKTHFRRFLPPNVIEFDLLRVIEGPQADPGHRWNYFIPLQIVYRNSLPLGASVFRRLRRRETTLQELGLSSVPRPNERLTSPMIEFTTKLEEIDRFINETEAFTISWLDPSQLSEVKDLTLRVDTALTRRAEVVGLEHADGKLEFGLDDRGALLLVDTAGTPDENRFLFEGIDVGKQLLRDFYAKTGLEQQVQRFVEMDRPRDTWPRPEPLPVAFIDAVSDVYRALCERWIGETIWGAPDLAAASRAALAYL